MWGVDGSARTAPFEYKVQHHAIDRFAFIRQTAIVTPAGNCDVGEAFLPTTLGCELSLFRYHFQRVQKPYARGEGRCDLSERRPDLQDRALVVQG